MLRLAVSTAVRRAVTKQRAFSRLTEANPTVNIDALTRNFSTLLRVGTPPAPCNSSERVAKPITLCANPAILNIANSLAPTQLQQCRTVVKFSMGSGKRKTVKAVVKRFKRLDWGGWIRTKSGRHKHMWRKKAARKRRLRQHVLVNSEQATLLDKMVTKYWKRPRHYVDDPYAPYHTREEFRETRRKPLNY